MTHKVMSHKFSNVIYMNEIAFATFTRVNHLHEFVEKKQKLMSGETEPEIRFVVYNGIPIICEQK